MAIIIYGDRCRGHGTPAGRDAGRACDGNFTDLSCLSRGRWIVAFCWLPCRDYSNWPWVSSSLGNNRRRSPYQRPIGAFGGSLCTSSGHSPSTSSRISSETSERRSVSSRNLCSRSKSSCTMMWSEITRGAYTRFGFDGLTFSAPLFVLFDLRQLSSCILRKRLRYCSVPARRHGTSPERRAKAERSRSIWRLRRSPLPPGRSCPLRVPQASAGSLGPPL